MPAEPTAAWSAVSQSALPALKARQEVAGRKAAARKLWFAGKSGFDEAFPDLVGARLGSESVVAGRLAALDAAAAERAMQRVAPLPALGDASRQRALGDAVQKALDAEDTADELERRLLVGLRAFHGAHPELSDEKLAPTYTDLDAAWRDADEAARSGPEEGRAAAAARAAALDAERVSLDRLVADLRRTGTVPGASVPSPDADLLRAADADAARWAVARLVLLRPFVSADTAARIDAAAAALPKAPPPPDPQVRGEVERARDQAALASEAAQVARESAAEARDVRLAELRESSAAAFSRAAEAWEAAKALTERDGAKRAELESAYGLATTRAGSVKARLGFGQDEVDKAYADLRSLVEALRAETRDAGEVYTAVEGDREVTFRRAADERALIDAARWETRSESDMSIRGTRDEALARWEAALHDELRAHARAVVVARDHRDAVATMLLDARQARRALRPQISAAELTRDQAKIWVEVGAELELLGPSTAAAFRERLGELREIPRALLDLNRVVDFLRGSLLTVLVVLLWWFLRARSKVFARSALDRLLEASPRLRRDDVDPVAPPLERLLRGFIDWSLGWMLVAPIGELVPTLGYLLQAFVFIAAWRVLVSLYDVLVVRHPDTRVGLVAVPAEGWDLGARTIRVVATWALIRVFLRYVLFNILATDAIDRVVHTGLDIAGFVILAVLLHRWEPLLRRRIQRLQQSSGIVRFLSPGPPSPVLRAPWAAAEAAWLIAAWTWALVNQIGRRREWLEQLLNVVTRYRLKEDLKLERERPPIPAEVRAVLQAEDPPPSTRVDRPEVDGALWSAWTEWSGAHRQGFVAIVGDRGSGKRTAVDLFVGKLRAEQGSPDVVRQRIGRRLRTEADAMQWAKEAWGLAEVPDNADSLARLLLDLPPKVLVVEATEAAFLRTVNGFHALKALLYTASACAHRHFFVFTVHRPAWRYISQLGSLVNTGVFGTMIHVPRMDADLLRQIALARLAAAGWSADFQGLVRSSPFGGDPEVELDRATTSFFRLLAEASSGTPAIALDMFGACLAPSAQSAVADVFMARPLELDIVEGLTTGDLFTLVALRTQDLLHLDEIVEVTNMAPGEVKTTVKHLEQRGLVAVAAGWVRVHEAKIAAVTRTLRRRQFLRG